MKLVTKSEINKLDADTISNYHVPSILLMEHAAYKLFEYIQESHKGKSIFILCGPGNNGGDGLALARQLISFGESKVKVGLIVSRDKLSEDGKSYYAICEALGIPCLKFPDEKEEIENEIIHSEVIVDSIFGTGLSRKVEGELGELFVKINNSRAFKLSVDIPSGIACDTGKVLGVAIKADCTITFQMGKVGLFLYPGISYTGELRIVPIGIPKELILKLPSKHYAIDKEMAKKILPIRPMRSNKGTYGKVLMIGGQVGMSGAICLATLGTMRVGAGLVTMAVPYSLCNIVEQKVTEAMTLPLPETDGHLNEEAAKLLKDRLPSFNVISIGPGLGRSLSVQKVMEEVLAADKITVVDADGLYALKPYLERLKERKAPIIITPHVGEMSYLSGESIGDILENPIESAKAFSAKYNVIVVLKLERMIVAIPRQDNIYINTKGHQAIAKGGAGDVLTGFITGLVAQNKQPTQASLLGVYLHGYTTQKLVEEKGEYSVLPSDLLDYVSESFKEISSL